MAKSTDTTETTEKIVTQEPEQKTVELQKALALRLHPEGIIVIHVNQINRVGASVQGSPTCTVNGLVVKHSIEQVLNSLGWVVSPPNE